MHSVLFAFAIGCINAWLVDSTTVQVDAEFRRTCALVGDATVKCWGYNFDGQLGYGDQINRGDGPEEMGLRLRPVDLGTGRTAVQISTGSLHTCALLDDATAKCWGSNLAGRLGYGEPQNRGDGPNEMGDNLPAIDLGTGRTVGQIATGSHTCALLDDATVKCWGEGTFGQLGYGDPNNRGGGPGEMGNNLPAVDLGAGRTALQIAPGFGYTCVRLDDATVKCWGRGLEGRLGYGDESNRGDGPGEMGDDLPAIDLGTGRTAVQVTVGDAHVCVLLDDATVKCWGKGFNGRLGYGDQENRGDGPNEMGDNLDPIELGTGRTALQITAGRLHTCALLDDATVKCWGEGAFGQLGYGDQNNRGDGPNEMGNNLPAVDLGTGRTAVQVAAGFRQTCAVLDDATVKCWGEGSFGQLGYGDQSNRGDGPGEMGDDLPTVDIEDALCEAPVSINAMILR